MQAGPTHTSCLHSYGFKTAFFFKWWGVSCESRVHLAYTQFRDSISLPQSWRNCYERLNSIHTCPGNRYINYELMDQPGEDILSHAIREGVKDWTLPATWLTILIHFVWLPTLKLDLQANFPWISFNHCTFKYIQVYSCCRCVHTHSYHHDIPVIPSTRFFHWSTDRCAGDPCSFAEQRSCPELREILSPLFARHFPQTAFTYRYIIKLQWYWLQDLGNCIYLEQPGSLVYMIYVYICVCSYVWCIGDVWFRNSATWPVSNMLSACSCPTLINHIIRKDRYHTVDGRDPAPPRMYI